ncbi:MAG TPA: hypothetical protein VHX42_01685 [Candidatus Babeliales bacterium]|jgi:hypothetical protein|nr:hypothetical protein [Candidatus Babeliales bacterium]
MQSFLKTFLITILITTPLIAKRPKKEKPPKEPRPALSQEQKQAIVSNVAQVMGGVCTIVQDPHNHHNIGLSIANMIHGLMSIIVEKFAHRAIDFDGEQEMQECINELSQNISKEVTDIIITRNMLRNL